MPKVHPRGGAVLYKAKNLNEGFGNSVPLKLSAHQRNELQDIINFYLDRLSAQEQAPKSSVLFKKLKKFEKSTQSLSDIIGQILSSHGAEDKLIQDQLNTKLLKFQHENGPPLGSMNKGLLFLLDGISELNSEYHDRYGGTKGREKDQEKHQFTLELCAFYEKVAGKKPTFNFTSTSGENKAQGPFVRFLEEVNACLQRKARVSPDIARVAVREFRQGKKPPKYIK